LPENSSTDVIERHHKNYFKHTTPEGVAKRKSYKPAHRWDGQRTRMMKLDQLDENVSEL